jgi:hypothetical protein
VPLPVLVATDAGYSQELVESIGQVVEADTKEASTAMEYGRQVKIAGQTRSMRVVSPRLSVSLDHHYSELVKDNYGLVPIFETNG